MDMIHVKTAIHKKMNKIEITDLTLPELQVYTSLNEAQLLHYYEPAPGIFIAESPKVIERALEFGCEPISLLMEQKDFDTCGKNIIAQCKNIPVYTAKLEVLEQITGYKLARGMLCAMHRPAMPSAEEICKKARRIAVLENVVNPTNVGAIFRSAAALNMDAVLLTSACSDPLYRRAIRVSMGTVFQVPWTYIENKNVSWPQGGMDLLHEYGFKTVAMALRNDSVRIDEEKLHEEEKLAIILGTEGDSLTACFSMAGMKVELSGSYSGWQPNVDSPILHAMTLSYKQQFGIEPAVKVIHAGLECGIIGANCPGLDMISFGPTLRSPHSPDERAYIPSVTKFYDFLVATLEQTPEK